jgi:hypothetical protein
LIELRQLECGVQAEAAGALFSRDGDGPPEGFFRRARICGIALE